MRSLALLLGFFALFCLAGCGGRSPFRLFSTVPPSCISWHTTPRAAEPLRVAVLPFAISERVGKGANEVTSSLADSLRELGLYEVTLVGPERAATLPLPDLHAGGVSVDSLLAVRDATGCDAVIVGRIEQFDGFHPVSLGLSAHLVSCHDGAVLWSVHAQLDSRREEVQDDIEGWWKRTRGDEATAVNGWKSVLSTPREFCRYATDRLAWTMEKEPD